MRDIAIYRSGVHRDDQEPVGVTRDELLALKAFGLVWFSAPAPGEFRIVLDREKEFTRFLKQYRGGKA